MAQNRELAQEKKKVIINKGTELPFTGKFHNFNEKLAKASLRFMI